MSHNYNNRVQALKKQTSTDRNPANKVALIIGASGLVGEHLLTLLLSSSMYSQVVVLARKPILINHHKLTQCIINFADIEAQLSQWPKVNNEYVLAANSKVDHIYCTLGTTIKKAGCKQAFQQVDCDYPVMIAKHFYHHGATMFSIVTAVGANVQSGHFYNKVKGLVESNLHTIGYQHLAIFRPSMLSGNRKEFRLGEFLGSKFMSLFCFLIPQRYQIIDAAKVAKAMLAQAKSPKIGLHVIESEKLQQY
jgi:uncharacterized protein YbjT (DUF2867 family)